MFGNECHRGIMIKLRPYQKEVVDTIKEQFLNTTKQYIEMPTGAGKTVTFLSYAKENHFRILILVPTKELLNQIYESALLFFEKKEIIYIIYIGYSFI